jgi:hypothetical protein
MSTFAIKRAVIAVCALLLVSGMLTRCIAQTTYGSIVGTARDASGAVIVGANITITNVGTSVKTTQLTNGVGAYSFNTLFPGAYTIHAEMQNFKSEDIQNIQLQVNQTIRYDLTMQLGQVSQNVVVTETLATLNTDTADVGEVIENRQVVDLPLNGRQFVQLAALANDVYLVGPNNNGDSAGNQITSEGSRLFSNSYLFDGVEIRIERGGSYGVSPSVDALGEFKLLQNTFSAEYGYGQTILAATIKNGTNQFHGVGFDFIRNDALDANNAFNTSGKKNQLKQQQFGGSFGGPIKKEKLFFFANYEAQRTTVGNVSNLLNPTATELSGDLSGESTIAIDPLTGKQFEYNGVKNVIPPGRIGNFAKQIAPYFVAPSGTPGPGYNLSAVTNETQQNDQGLARIDYYMSQKDHIDGFVSMNKWNDIDPGVNPYTGMAIWRKGYPIVGAEWAHTFSPTIVNNFHFGYAHQQIYEGQSEIATSNLSGTVFGVNNINPDAFALGIPYVSVSGFSATGPGAWQPTGDLNINTQYSDMVMITRGHHILTVGGDFRNITYGDLGWATQNGEFDFNGSYTTGYDVTGKVATPGTGNGMADLLLGVPNYAHAALKGAGDYPYNLQWTNTSAFAQDDWRISSELTLNLGVRWELVQNAREVNNQFVNFDTATQTMLYAGKTMPDRIYPAQKTNFLPRIGAAYSPKWLPKTVIRGGFSITTGGARAWEFAQQHFQPPYVNENFDYNSVDSTTQNLPAFQIPGSNITVPAGSKDAAPYLLFSAPVTTCCTGVNLVPVALNDVVEKKVPKYAEWNFNIQHELPGAFVLQVGYVGTHGYSLPIRYDTNLATTPYNPADPATANVQSRVPYPTLGYICGNTFEGYSSFDALNLHLERRFANGVSLTAAYSWAKDLEVATQDEAELFDIKNLRLNYGPNNMAQHAVFNYIYELPFGHGKALLGNANRAADLVVGGWQFDGITTWNSGSYIGAGSDVNNAMGGRAGNYPDAVAGENPNSGSGIHTRSHWFNTAAFANPPYTRYGNSHADTIIGPGMVDFDFAFFKNFKYNESKYFQFRWEMFNAFNHVNLYNPGTDYGGGTTPSSSFAVITGSNDARIMQIGLKFYF